MNDKKLRRLIQSALMAALVCVATMVLQVPSPTGGYVNLGDGVVLLSAWLLGPWYGGAAAGLGTMLTDLIMGYAAYAPGSLVIKGAMGVVAALIFRAMGRHLSARLVSGAVAEAIMVVGYFVYTALLLGRGLGALASVPGNLVQGAVGIVVATAVIHALAHKIQWDTAE